jgi:hypothetical protein
MAGSSIGATLFSGLGGNWILDFLLAIVPV